MLLELVPRHYGQTGALSYSTLICASRILRGFVFLICLFLVFADANLQEEGSTVEPTDESLSAAYEPNTNRNLNLPDHQDKDNEGYEKLVPNFHQDGEGEVKSENDVKGLYNKDVDVPTVEVNSSTNSSEEAVEKVADHSNEVEYKENLSLREILRRLMPPQLSTIGESEQSTSKDLDSSEHNPSSEEYEKDDDHLPNSGSDISCNASTSENDTLNAQENITTKASNGSVTKKAACVETERTEVISDVEIINATVLQQFLQTNPNITNRASPAKCYVVYFFSSYCPFSTQGSAYVNALARSLPNIPVYGIDSIEYHSLNARYGIMGTPSLVLFHNGNVAGRFNASEFSTYYLESFIHHFTDQKLLSINVTSQDFKANLPSQTLRSTPYALYFAWAFLLACGGYLFLNSTFYATLMEAFVNNWREAEAQHEHDD